MKNLRTLGAAFVLALMLAVPALAGHIETPVTSHQSLSTSTTATPETGSDSAAGHIETPLASTDAVTQAVLSLINSVLALF